MGAQWPERLLIVSRSARMLVVSAARAGLRPVAIDLYGDCDTREAAAAVATVGPGPRGFDPRQLLEAAARLAPPGVCGLVYGSGLDGAPELLEQLAVGRRVFGNGPALLRQLKTPAEFFSLLRRLGIPYPEIRTTPPPDPDRWLVKSGCSEGGNGVGFCAQAAALGDRYFQRRLPGDAMSALFLADGENARILGFNTLWTVSQPGRPFLFAGAVNRADLSSAQRRAVTAQILHLVRETGLKGLNSVDFMEDGGICRLLEINPRPSATMALYDPDIPEGLLALHLSACGGSLAPVVGAGATVRAFRAVFAPRTLTVPAALFWPEWCADRPLPGSRIGAGQPLCTVSAEGHDRRTVEAALAERAEAVLEALYRAAR
ncbi:Predicted ATP-dependent carboligase, ATP-grasp superfamily [Candidatus Methylocalor cossyra]|uniref:Predicted ATP-dependent carboligase, ATP-grasp superfamily n=2 Tax=Candidatus Methylocalor cossyra TaxID=3108543 RepID=A0ABM9NEG4_9GAMM